MIWTYRCRNKSQHADWSFQIWVYCWVWTKPSSLTLWSPPLGLDELRKDGVLPGFGVVTGHGLITHMQSESLSLKSCLTHLGINPTVDQLTMLNEPLQHVKKTVAFERLSLQAEGSGYCHSSLSYKLSSDLRSCPPNLV